LDTESQEQGIEMSQPINYGGPAFPCVYYSEPIGSIGPQFTIKGGMTLRDYLAAAALQGLMSSQCQVDDPYPIYAYRIADAMLKAREAQP
jgi:hypothetical protein